MKLSEYPNLSKLFKDNVYAKFFEYNADTDIGLTKVDEFLSLHPYYPEALVFKAQMLIAKGKNREALKYLKAAQKIDEWRVHYAFDEAEVLYLLGKKNEALQCLKFGIEKLLQEVLDGSQNFLLSICSAQTTDFAYESLKNEMIRFVSKESKSIDIDKLIELLEG